MRKIKCDEEGNCEELEDMHHGGEVEVVADIHHGGHGNVMIFRSDELDGKVMLRCPEGDATVAVEQDEAEDVFLCPKHSIPMEKAPAKKLIREFHLKDE